MKIIDGVENVVGGRKKSSFLIVLSVNLPVTCFTVDEDVVKMW